MDTHKRAQASKPTKRRKRKRPSRNVAPEHESASELSASSEDNTISGDCIVECHSEDSSSSDQNLPEVQPRAFRNQPAHNAQVHVLANRCEEYVSNSASSSSPSQVQDQDLATSGGESPASSNGPQLLAMTTDSQSHQQEEEVDMNVNSELSDGEQDSCGSSGIEDDIYAELELPCDSEVDEDNTLDVSDASSSDSVFSESGDELNDNNHPEKENEEIQSASDEEELEQQEGDQPLYAGAPLTLNESLLAIFKLAAVDHLSGKLLANILELVVLHCPLGSICKRTLYKFKKYFAKIGESLVVFHFFCSDCIYPLKSKTSQCPKCDNAGNISYFLEIPLIHQLQSLFSRRDFVTHLQGRFDISRKKHADNIDDIYDGKIYKEQMDEGFLNDPHSLSFLWYSDGIATFKSSNFFSLWPLCLVINELPYKERILPQNILLVGLWFGSSKPNPNVFLKPIFKAFKIFSRHGYKLKLDDDSEVVVRGKIICGTCDLPAKSKFLLFKQFNGEYGCSKCLHPGERYPVGRRGTVQVYPYSRNIEARTHEQVRVCAQQALQARVSNKEASVQGVKGMSLLYYMVPDLIRCTAIDIMHGVFLGVCKLLTHLWFHSSFSTQPWTLHHLIDIIDGRLKNIKPPCFVQRAPRSIHSILHWKASEFKLWLTYYSIPLLWDVMEKEYFEHHCKLVSAIFLLNQDSISPAQIHAASNLLHSYVSDFARLYSLRYMGMNVHQLLHLPEVVIDLAPLWVYSCFFLESFNGAIAKLFHGTQHIALQICSSIAMFMKMPILVENLPVHSVVYKFCRGLTSHTQPIKIADVISNGIFAVGTYSQSRNAIQHSRAVIRRTLHLNGGDATKIFFRLKKQGILYVSSEYGRVSQRKESSFVLFSDNSNMPCLGRMLRFVRWPMCTPEQCVEDCRMCPIQYFVIARVYARVIWEAQQIPGARLSYISKVKRTENDVAFPVERIIYSCFYFTMRDEEFIASPVNQVEVE